MVPPVSAEAIAIAGVGVALLAVLVPVVVTQGRRLDQRLDELRSAMEAQGAAMLFDAPGS